MTALAASRREGDYTALYIELAATAQQVYKGGIACFDTSTGLVAKAAASTTMIPIGEFTEDKLVASGGTVIVKLFRELKARWMVNATAGDAVVSTDVGKLAYLVDDQTVANNDNTNTRSTAGRIWKLDSTKGVLVEFIQSANAHLGGLDF